MTLNSKNYLDRLANLSRKSKVLIQILTDISMSFGCFFSALLLGSANPNLIADPVIFLGMVISIISGMISFVGFGLYRSFVRFVTGNIFKVVAAGALIGSSVLVLFILITEVKVPLTVPFIYALLLFLSSGGIRLAIRRLFRNTYKKTKRPAVIYGAGEAGRELQNTLFHSHQIKPVAFIDDNSAVQGLTMGGCRVYSNNSFAKVAKKYGVELVLLALPTISRQRRKEIIEIFQDFNIEIKSVPPISKILTGQALISELRPVTAEMLLGRDPIAPIEALMQGNILNGSVMVTGAGGTIGAELCRQILAQRPLKLILFELSELALYQIFEELQQIKNKTKSACAIVPVLGSVQDKKRILSTIKNFGVTSIYHAAAYKHVPLVEDNVIEGINNNVFGTFTLVQSAIELDVENFTLISTDKAVRPTNVMGASKRIAELICQAFAKEVVKTKLAMVRFGNVLGSSGSVIPLFQKQIEAGGPVTITHTEITRYFMTISEAAELVLQASAMTKSGDVFVLDMGEPVKIADLAVEMIKLEGLKPYFIDQPIQVSHETGHIPICITGLRSGEKLYEELLIHNNPQPTEHPRIMKSSEVSLSMGDISRKLEQLRDACSAHNIKEVLNILKKMPIEFSHDKVELPGFVNNSAQTDAVSKVITQPKSTGSNK